MVVVVVEGQSVGLWDGLSVGTSVGSGVGQLGHPAQSTVWHRASHGTCTNAHHDSQVVGLDVGCIEGIREGFCVGSWNGFIDGDKLGSAVGLTDGVLVGSGVGQLVHAAQSTV